MTQKDPGVGRDEVTDDQSDALRGFLSDRPWRIREDEIEWSEGGKSLGRPLDGYVEDGRLAGDAESLEVLADGTKRRRVRLDERRAGRAPRQRLDAERARAGIEVHDVRSVEWA